MRLSLSYFRTADNTSHLGLATVRYAETERKRALLRVELAMSQDESQAAIAAKHLRQPRSIQHASDTSQSTPARIALANMCNSFRHSVRTLRERILSFRCVLCCAVMACSDRWMSCPAPSMEKEPPAGRGTQLCSEGLEATRVQRASLTVTVAGQCAARRPGVCRFTQSCGMATVGRYCGPQSGQRTI
jgi:hypothetical protein